MDGLCFGKDGTLKAALPRNLVSFFIDENEDQEALAKFLMTFPVVISAEEVWNVMSTKYEALAAASAVEKERILAFLQSPEYLLSVERWPFHTEPPDHYVLLSYLLDLSVSQLSTLMPLHY
eukprot:TRINITY_DN928_c0_g1_i3.p1 TRINITY_DN928_c0_g1~~TRINITY_DN928_c0_g1_i3.p1  ORF type:complete len:121 (+),score=1.70 TRINITY_DN928_c0_g1_i3:146-508(+)